MYIFLLTRLEVTCYCFYNVPDMGETAPDLKWICCPKKVFSASCIESPSTVTCPGCGSFFHKSCAKLKQKRKNGFFVVCCGTSPSAKRHRRGTCKGNTEVDSDDLLSEDSDIDPAPNKVYRGDSDILGLSSPENSSLTMPDSNDSDMKDLSSGSITSYDDLFKRLDEREARRSNQISQQMSSLSSRIAELTTRVDDRMNAQDVRIDEVSAKVNNFVESFDPLALKFAAVEEIREQLYRGRNLVIHKAPEGTPESDLALVKGMAGKVQGLNKNNLIVRRLGASADDKSRPLLVRFGSEADASKMFGARKKFTDLGVSRDRTMDERNLIKRLGAEIDQLKVTNPEQDWIIKWFNGVPKRILNSKKN